MLPHESAPFEWTIEGQSVSVFEGRDGEVQYFCILYSDCKAKISFLTKIVVFEICMNKL